MKNHNHYTVIPAKCAKTKELFGIRGIYHDGAWHLTWAFKMTESQAKGEHFEENILEGRAVFDTTYPGCPYCKGTALIKCSCGHISCSTDAAVKDDTTVTCAWCESKSRPKISDDITGTKGGGF